MVSLKDFTYRVKNRTTLYNIRNSTPRKYYLVKKNALYVSVNVFSTKVLIGDTIFTPPNGDGTAILRGNLIHAKV